MINKMRVFLGGTCNDSTWREELIPLLEERDVEYFNPVVDDWTEECQKIEDDVKANPLTVNLFVITSQMTGVYSIAEMVDSVHVKSYATIVLVLSDGFDDGQLKSLKAVTNIIEKRGGMVAKTLTHAANLLLAWPWGWY